MFKNSWRAFKKISTQLLPKVKIHTWGGLGSQLYAVALAVDINKRYPSRQIEFICHTGGVTERFPEIAFFTENIIIKNDFKTGHIISNSKKLPIKVFYITLIKKVLTIFGILSLCNSSKEFDKLKPWVLSIRGHYIDRVISHSTLLIILSKINDYILPIKNNKFQYLSVHYRLGDLLTLTEKNPIEVNILNQCVVSVLNSSSIKELYLYSDSLGDAMSRIDDLSSRIKITPKELSALPMILECVQSAVFIGTNSKISVWIAFLRATKTENNRSYLPSDICHVIRKGFNSDSVERYINYY